VKVARGLPDRGADINGRDRGGKTDLNLAQGKGIEEIGKLLKARSGSTSR
jgi:ankyrin repeat protein